MRAFVTHSAARRGVSMIARMLKGRWFAGKPAQKRPEVREQLVSWHANTRSRREDELARMRQVALF